jgi:mycothiol synthase
MFESREKVIIEVPETPPVAGLHFRGFMGDSDFEIMSKLIAACKDADHIERTDSPDDIRRNYSHLVNSNPYQDMLFAEIHGQTVGYGRTDWYRVESENSRIYQSFGFLRPDWRRKKIGTAMLHWNQAHLRQIAASHPQDGARFYESFVNESETGNEALLRADGYEAVRHFNQMVRPNLDDVPDLPLPAGIEVRPVQPDQYHQVWAANDEAFRDHWGYSEDLEPYEAWLDQRNQQPELWQVAWAGDEVAGMVLNYIDTVENEEYHRRRGWTENICVRRQWRGQGLAKALIARSLNLLKAQSMNEAALGVDAQNLSGAFRLYEHMGFRTVKRSSDYRKRMETREG